MLAASFAISVEAARCVARSGSNAAALVELYTSSGCPGCARAERWLASIAPRQGVVALRVAVDGPNARRDAWVRTRKLTNLQRLAFVSAPHVLLQGREFQGWDTPAFDEALAKILATPARASLALEVLSVNDDSLVVRAVAELRDARPVQDWGLYLAAYDSGLVLEWRGPLPFTGARLEVERSLSLLPGALAANSGVVGFVQGRRNSSVLQALMLPACP